MLAVLPTSQSSAADTSSLSNDHGSAMKSPPVEDMFAELESEDGDDHVLPRRSKVKIYYSRDELLALKDSPLVKIPQGMSPASEWFR